MGTILTIASSKGGSGKTTLTVCLAANLAALGFQLIVIDTDANASFSEWHANAYEGVWFGCIAECREAEVRNTAVAEAEHCDIVLIDTAGLDRPSAAAAISTADFVLIPTMPDRYSVREAIRTARRIESWGKVLRRTLPYCVMGTQWQIRGQAEGAALEALADESLPVLTRTLPNLTAFCAASFTGRVPVSGRAGLEVNAIITELVGLGAIPAPAGGASGVGPGRSHAGGGRPPAR
jgi:chromosome partitioning protein